MEATNQKQVWDNIAKEWDKLKKPKPQTLEFIKTQKGKILDLGSGSGRYLIKKKGLKFYLLDFSKEMIKIAKKKAKRLNVDAEFIISELDKIPFQDNFFDSAIYLDSLHCIHSKQKRKKSLKELFRVLKPKAIAKISVWNKDSKRFKNSPKKRVVKWMDKGPRNYYLYNPEELYKEIKETGFDIIKKPIPTLELSVIIQKPN